MCLSMYTMTIKHASIDRQKKNPNLLTDENNLVRIVTSSSLMLRALDIFVYIVYRIDVYF